MPDFDQAPSSPTTLTESVPLRVFTWTLILLMVTTSVGLVGWLAHTPLQVDNQVVLAADTCAFWANDRRCAPRPVSVEKVVRQNFPITLTVMGNTSAAAATVVRAPVMGVLKRVNFREGQLVQAGQVLAQIDPHSILLQLLEAKTALVQAQAQLRRVKSQMPRDRQSTSSSPQNDAQNALVKSLELSVQKNRIRIDNLRTQLNLTRIKAPVAGRVGFAQANVGSMVQPSDPGGIVAITPTRPMNVVFELPAKSAKLLASYWNAHQEVAVQAWQRNRKTGVGKVVGMETFGQNQRITAAFDNENDVLAPRQVVRLVVPLDTLRGVLAVPQSAVLHNDHGAYVFVVNPDGTVVTRWISTPISDNGWVVVEGALKEGDTVVVSGAERLRQGVHVEIVNPHPSKPP